MLVFLCGGCGGLRLAQTNDTELAYALPHAGPAPDPEEETASSPLVPLVRARLAAARVAADVQERDGVLHVVVDSDAVSAVDPLLRWPGGIALYRVDAQTNARIEPPLVDFAGRIARVEAVRHGHDLMIYTTVAMRAPPKEPLAIVLADTVLAVQQVEGSPIVVSFGDDLDSYARADRARRLLESGRAPMPPLTKLAERKVPPRWDVALLGLFLPVLLSFGWLSFVRRFDRAHPEPRWLVAVTFALGGASALVAFAVEYALVHATPYLDPSRMTLGGQWFALPLALAVFTLVVGAVEEGAKWLGVSAFALRRREFDEPVDGIVYGVAASLGFAAVENIRYFAVGRLATSMVVLRAFTSVPAHMFFGAIWGYALGRKLVAPRTRVWAFLLLAALLHGAYDTFLSMHYLVYLTLVLHIVLTSLFVVLLRRALRRGVIAHGEVIPESTRRLSFAFGSRATFAFWVIALHVAALAIVALGIQQGSRSQSVNLAFLAAASALFVLFAVCAHGLCASLPLEAVVDENGITFGGASRAWNEIQSFDRRKVRHMFGEAFEIVVHSPKGPLRIGPGKEDATKTLAACLSSFTLLR
ncbi:MAG TPA: PrsW family intramembrane metalloprotease [Polyangiaceae bacterium]|nr:PrsW family intramembrane metalloprotease [Polyangiaceae bacterium]